jgi:hypothetical protein
VSGCYFLARCGAQSADERAARWEIFLRRPLFAVSHMLRHDTDSNARDEQHERWRLALPSSDDPGFAWLRGLLPGAPVNLIGPLGNGFYLAPTTRNLLVVADVVRLAPLTALFDAVLDRGGHVTLALREGAVDAELQTQLPVAVEVQTLPPGAEWLTGLAAPLRWADQLCLALPAAAYAPLAEAIRRQRLRLESGFAFALVEPTSPVATALAWPASRPWATAA